MLRKTQAKRSALALSLLALVFLIGTQAAAAKGCIKGAAVGAVAGHVAGHHAVAGAVVGCAVGHHLAKKKQQELRQQQAEPLKPQQQTQPLPAQAV
jgi:outer membrane lipoprotein SlyB